MYLYSSSYLISAIKAVLLGSYSSFSTTPTESILSLLKSIFLYNLLCPPPRLLDVILPLLFLPDFEGKPSVSFFIGLSFDKEDLSTKTRPLCPGLVG